MTEVVDSLSYILYYLNMIRVKLLKDWKEFKKGQVVHVSKNEAFGLVDSGRGVVTRDFLPEDMELAKESVKKRAKNEGGI